MGAGRGRLALRLKGRTGEGQVYSASVTLSKFMSAHKINPGKRVPDALLGHAVAGAFMILIGYFLAYLVQFDWLLGAWATPFVLMVVVAVMVMVLLTVRGDEGQLQFGRAFGLALFSGWLARLGYNVFNLLLFSVMRPDLKVPYADLVVEKSMEAFELLGVDTVGGDRDEMKLLTMFREEAEWTLTPLGQLRDGMLSLVWVALVALVVSAILQRNSH